ncbi:MAG: beta-galactosidase small subunit [Lachnospiraceae bacterium]|nr:beta-galactosidase small subunit [Lachnospiraceae bacterium]
MENINKEETKLRLVFGDVTLGVHGSNFSCIFSYQTGGLESLVKDGREWLYRTPRPTFWRAVTDNDRGNGFPIRSGVWLAADMFMKSMPVSVAVDGKNIPFPKAPLNNKYTGEETAESVEIAYCYETITVPSTIVAVCYTVSADAKIHVQVRHQGKKGLPELPVFGMRFVMPTLAEGYIYEGLSGETYPDRMAGGIAGTYEVKGLPVTPYLVPQECGMHMESKRVTVLRNTVLDNTAQKLRRSGLTVLQGEKPFAFSCLPYTAEELENATHQEELPPARRTVLCVLGAVRGVGGIDSWGTDVTEPYHIDATQDIAYDFYIE